MRITKALPALVLLLALVAGTASAYISENPRQGLAPISAESHLEPTAREPGPLLGFELRFLGFCIRSGLISTDPFGEDISDAIVLLGGQGIGCDLAGAYLLEDWDKIFAIGQSLPSRGLLQAYYEMFRDPELFAHRGLLISPFVRDTGSFVSWGNNIFERSFEAQRTDLPVRIAEEMMRRAQTFGLQSRDRPPTVEKGKLPKDCWHINMVSPNRSGNIHVPVPEKYVVPGWL